MVLPSAASAGPVPSVPPHRHWLMTPNGPIQVGPSACDNPSAKNGFDHFHAHVHLGQPQVAFANDGNPIALVASGCNAPPPSA